MSNGQGAEVGGNPIPTPTDGSGGSIPQPNLHLEAPPSPLMSLNEVLGYPPPPSIPADNPGAPPQSAPSPTLPPPLNEALTGAANLQQGNVAPTSTSSNLSPAPEFSHQDEVVLIGHAHHGDDDWWP